MGKTSKRWPTLKSISTAVGQLSFLLPTLGGCGVILVTAFLFSTSLSSHTQNYQNYRESLANWSDLDAKFDQEILKARYELFASYDALVNNLERQIKNQKELENIPSFINFQTLQQTTSILERHRSLLERKEELSEQFKSRNALLKNSLRYLPLLTNQVEAKLIADSVTLQPAQIGQLRQILNELIRSLLLYNIAVDDQLTEKIDALTTQLTQLQANYDLTPDQFPSQLVLSHAKVIVLTKPQVEQLTRQLLVSQQSDLQLLKRLVKQGYQERERTVALFRVVTVFWLLLLLGLANYLWWRHVGRRPLRERIKTI